MNFVAILTLDGEPVGGSVVFFDNREDCLDFCTDGNTAIKPGYGWRWVIRELKEVF